MLKETIIQTIFSLFNLFEHLLTALSEHARIDELTEAYNTFRDFFVEFSKSLNSGEPQNEASQNEEPQKELTIKDLNTDSIEGLLWPPGSLGKLSQEYPDKVYDIICGFFYERKLGFEVNNVIKRYFQINSFDHFYFSADEAATMIKEISLFGKPFWFRVTSPNGYICFYLSRINPSSKTWLIRSTLNKNKENCLNNFKNEEIELTKENIKKYFQENNLIFKREADTKTQKIKDFYDCKEDVLDLLNKENVAQKFIETLKFINLSEDVDKFQKFLGYYFEGTLSFGYEFSADETAEILYLLTLLASNFCIAVRRNEFRFEFNVTNKFGIECFRYLRAYQIDVHYKTLEENTLENFRDYIRELFL